MVVDNLQYLTRYDAMNPAFAKAAVFLAVAGNLAIGRHEIDGDKLFAIRADYETKLQAESVWEAHRAYGDIHVLLDGQERLGYAPLDIMKSKTAYDAESDVELFTGTGDFITLRPGMFCIVAPNDVHLPGQAIDNRRMPIKKLVFKWKV